MNKDYYPIVVGHGKLLDQRPEMKDLDVDVKCAGHRYAGSFWVGTTLGAHTANARQMLDPTPPSMEIDNFDPTWLSAACAAQTLQHKHVKLGRNVTFYGGGDPVPMHQDLKVVNVLKKWRLGVAPAGTPNRFDINVLVPVLFDLSKVDRFEALPEWNVGHWSELDWLPSTSTPTPILDERAVALLESRQQRDAIMLSKDFRAALETLVDEEQFSYYDLTQAIGVTRAMLSQWRDRPLEKVRQASQARMSRLLFAWKYWLHATEGDMLGRYLRHVPEGSTASLLDLLSRNDPTDDEVAALIDRLARYATEDRKAASQRRRDVGGLPKSAYQPDLVPD